MVRGCLFLVLWNLGSLMLLSNDHLYDDWDLIELYASDVNLFDFFLFLLFCFPLFVLQA